MPEPTTRVSEMMSHELSAWFVRQCGAVRLDHALLALRDTILAEQRERVEAEQKSREYWERRCEEEKQRAIAAESRLADAERRASEAEARMATAKRGALIDLQMAVDCDLLGVEGRHDVARAIGAFIDREYPLPAPARREEYTQAERECRGCMGPCGMCRTPDLAERFKATFPTLYEVFDHHGLAPNESELRALLALADGRDG